MAHIDALGINCYRDSNGFQRLIQAAHAGLNLPIIFSEFGRPDTKGGTELQSGYIRNIWDIISRNYGRGGAGNVLGGFIHEFTDEPWKENNGKGEGHYGILGKPAAEAPFKADNSHGPKAWESTYIRHLDLIAKVLYETCCVKTEGIYHLSKNTFSVNIRAEDGTDYTVTLREGSSHFLVRETNGETAEEKIIFFMPLGKGNIIMPPGLYKQIQEMERSRLIFAEAEAHETFEAKTDNERIMALNRLYTELDTEDRKTFLNMFAHSGIKLISEKNRISGWERISGSGKCPFGHIGGEILELIEEYRARGTPHKLSSFRISSLDAALLGIRLGEILQAKINIDEFTDILASPAARQKEIVLKTAGTAGIIPLTVAEAEEGILSINMPDVHSRAVLELMEFFTKKGPVSIRYNMETPAPAACSY